MKPVMKWLAVYFAALALPLVLVLGSYAAISYWMPGEILRETWASVSKVILYVAIPSILIVAYASKVSRWIRWPLATFGTMVFLAGIWYFQAIPRCDPYVGEKPIGPKQPPVRIASC